jgi:ribosomal subunit interface protein
MAFRVFFKHMTGAPALQRYALRKLDDRLAKYAVVPSEALLTFAMDAGTFCVACHIGRQGRNSINVESRDAVSMYAAVDELVDKVDSALRRAKEKQTARRSRTRIDELVSNAPGLEETGPEPDDASDYEEELAATEATETGVDSLQA